MFYTIFINLGYHNWLNTVILFLHLDQTSPLRKWVTHFKEHWIWHNFIGLLHQGRCQLLLKLVKVDFSQWEEVAKVQKSGLFVTNHCNINSFLIKVTHFLDFLVKRGGGPGPLSPLAKALYVCKDAFVILHSGCHHAWFDMDVSLWTSSRTSFRLVIPNSTNNRISNWRSRYNLWIIWKFKHWYHLNYV